LLLKQLMVIYLALQLHSCGISHSWVYLSTVCYDRASGNRLNP